MSSNKTSEGQLTLTQMLEALDKDVASGLEKKLKKLSKKTALKAPLDENKAELIKRQAGYSEVTKEVSQWDPVIERRRKADQLKFPLDQQPDYLPTTSETLGELKPRNDFEQQVQQTIQSSDTVLHDKQVLTKAEERYLKAISVEEAKARHIELQKMRVLLSSYVSKMRRQKAIKSKSYHRLLKQERIKRHMRKVESNKDLLADELNKLQKLRARERATLKHKNTGKWAKHAKFRSKYDEEARKAMLEQIGIAEKFLKKPAEVDSDSEESESSDDNHDDDDDDSDDNIIKDNDSNASSIDDDEMERRLDIIRKSANENADRKDMLIVSSELISDNPANKHNDGSKSNLPDGSGDDGEDDDEDYQRKLMSEAFADDDVVAEFNKAKEDLANEEQPKDKDSYLPGWGNWAGPGLKVNNKMRKKFVVKAKKRPRRDETLGNVIISEDADSHIKRMMVKKLPRNMRTDNQLERTINQPITATFTNQTTHRKVIKPRIVTKMGARIEPMNKDKVLRSKGAKWA